MKKLCWLVIVLGWLVAAYAGAGAWGSVKTLTPQDCRVMEEHLNRKGHRVRVESGSLAVAGEEVVAVLNCRTENGQAAFTWAYPLGPNKQAGKPVLQE